MRIIEDELHREVGDDEKPDESTESQGYQKKLQKRGRIGQPHELSDRYQQIDNGQAGFARLPSRECPGVLRLKKAHQGPDRRATSG